MAGVEDNIIQPHQPGHNGRIPHHQPILWPLSRKNFPKHFIFGTGSAAYQYEGAAKEDDKGESNWDHFTHTYPEKIKDHSNGDIAVDAYHKYKEDIALMKDMGVDAYRFSIAWTRILPNGKRSGGVNMAGVQYYNNLIDELIKNDIKPFVTIFHWDVPQALEDEYRGFLSDEIIDDFRDYADVCFEKFGDQVKFWCTMNEPWTFTTKGYMTGEFPPVKQENPATEAYVVGHHILLSHAAAVHIYRTKYQATQHGQIGITLNYHWMVPYSDSPADVAAAERASDFMLGWFMEPLTTGEYPQCMQERLGSRLPKFCKEQSEYAPLVKGSYDFLGLNYYTANYAADASSGGVQPPNSNYSPDSGCYQTTERHGVHIGKPTASKWLYIYPEGLSNAVIYIKYKYKNPVIYITENGISDDGNLWRPEALTDVLRMVSLNNHLDCLHKAMTLEDVDVKGYFVWSLLDNFEWNFGYTARFGMYYVDFNDGEKLKRYPKESARWFKDFLKAD